MNNEQNEGDNDNKNTKKKKEAKQNRFLIPFVSKAKKRIVFKIKRKPSSLNIPSSSSSSASSGFWKKVCFCGIEPSSTLEWSSSSSHDPEDVNFRIRVLLQTNDFFSKDCNPHLSLVVACFLYPCVRHDLPLKSAESSVIEIYCAESKTEDPRDSCSKVCFKNCWSIVQRNIDSSDWL